MQLKCCWWFKDENVIKFQLPLKYLYLSTIGEVIRYRFLDWECGMWKYMPMVTKLKTKRRIEEETDVLKTEEEELSQQKLGEVIKVKENMSGFPFCTNS